MRCLVVSNITDQERMSSEHGTDIIAYKFHNEKKTPTKEDELVAIEVKAKLSLKEICGVIQNAAADSTKDEYRVAHTAKLLIEKSLRNMGKVEESRYIERFQQKAELPYKSPMWRCYFKSARDLKIRLLQELRKVICS